MTVKLKRTYSAYELLQADGFVTLAVFNTANAAEFVEIQDSPMGILEIAKRARFSGMGLFQALRIVGPVGPATNVVDFLTGILSGRVLI